MPFETRFALLRDTGDRGHLERKMVSRAGTEPARPLRAAGGGPENRSREQGTEGNYTACVMPAALPAGVMRPMPASRIAGRMSTPLPGWAVIFSGGVGFVTSGQ